jgi:uncharacterized tellurite resistance protein B-like protein
MLGNLIDLFKPAPEQPPSPEQEHERLAVATCVILLETAAADDEFAPEEREHIVETLRDRFDLSHTDAQELLDMAEQERQQSNDLFQFTRVINDNCSVEEKMHVLEEVWRVIFADGELDGHEDHLVHRLAKLFNISHPKMIETKMRVLKEVREDS